MVIKESNIRSLLLKFNRNKVRASSNFKIWKMRRSSQSHKTRFVRSMNVSKCVHTTHTLQKWV